MKVYSMEGVKNVPVIFAERTYADYYWLIFTKKEYLENYGMEIHEIIQYTLFQYIYRVSKEEFDEFLVKEGHEKLFCRW